MHKLYEKKERIQRAFIWFKFIQNLLNRFSFISVSMGSYWWKYVLTKVGVRAKAHPNINIISCHVKSKNVENHQSNQYRFNCGEWSIFQLQSIHIDARLEKKCRFCNICILLTTEYHRHCRKLHRYIDMLRINKPTNAIIQQPTLSFIFFCPNLPSLYHEVIFNHFFFAYFYHLFRIIEWMDSKWDPKVRHAEKELC